MDQNKIYPRSNDNQTVYLKSVVTRPTIEDGGKIRKAIPAIRDGEIERLENL